MDIDVLVKVVSTIVTCLAVCISFWVSVRKRRPAKVKASAWLIAHSSASRSLEVLDLFVVLENKGEQQALLKSIVIKSDHTPVNISENKKEYQSRADDVYLPENMSYIDGGSSVVYHEEISSRDSHNPQVEINGQFNLDFPGNSDLYREEINSRNFVVEVEFWNHKRVVVKKIAIKFDY